MPQDPHSLETREDRLVLVGIDTPGSDLPVEESLAELARLVDTAGAKAVGTAAQQRPAPHQATYVGKGKLDEIRHWIEALDADGIVCDDELSPAQMRNLEEELNCKVLDRTMVILDIFSQHALSREGALQVELAQQRYRLSRLVGAGKAMSRLGGGSAVAGPGGGIGARGPGEKKLETDRRHIRERLHQLRTEIKEVARRRERMREQRRESHLPCVAIVGYTNAGKSTLINALTQAGVRAEDRLFATLDPVTRRFMLPQGPGVLLTDTVGFIRKLPHDLIDAFHSTLEEALYADLLLHVVDASDPNHMVHMDVVYDTLSSLGASGIPVVTAYNKIDALNPGMLLPNDPHAVTTLEISAATGQGLDTLVDTLAEQLLAAWPLIDATLPYKRGDLLSRVREEGILLFEEHTPEGTHIRARVHRELASRFDTLESL